MDHVIHGPPPPVWGMEPETQSYLVKAVVSLLQEAKPFGSRFAEIGRIVILDQLISDL